MNSRYRPLVFLAFALLVFVPRSARAAEIVGTAADSSGGVLPSARVALHNNATSSSLVTVTDAGGRFRFDSLLPGSYTVRVAFEGFSQQARTVTLGDPTARAELNFALQPGDLAVGVTVTATRAERDSMLVPLRTDTLARDQLDRTAPASTGDGLLQAPGITPVGSGPFEVRPRLRGLDSTRLLVLVDGERLNNARTATDRSGTEVGLVDVSSVASLEVVGGSGSVLYGTDALAGTINIVTNEVRFSDRLKATCGIDGYFSSNENGRRGTATVGVSSPRVAVTVAGTLEKFDNYRAGRAAREDTRPLFASGVLKQADTIDDAFHFSFGAFPDPFNAPFVRDSSAIPASAGQGSNINATGLFGLTGTQTLQVKYIRRRMEDVGFADLNPPMFFQRVSLPFSNLDRLPARYEARSITPWFTNLRISAYFQDQHRLLRNEFPVQFPVPSAGFFPINVFRLEILSDSAQHVQTPGLDVQATMLIRRRHVVTAGATVYGDRSRDQRTTVTQSTIIGTVALGSRGPQADIFASPIVLGLPSTSHPVRVPNALFRDTGFFVQDEWDVNRFLRVVGGLRADSYRVTTDPTPGYDIGSLIAGAQPAIDPAGLPSVDGDAVSRAALTGEIGVVVRASDVVSAVARYGRSYRHANLEELLFSGPATVGAIVPNMAVRPETGNNVD
ncbi:MAG: TonB-dependent receptor, partial [Planctomycetes bacterium]|nr:TonB-dependent receptor [Planctomycetota bacterium]